MLLTTPLTTFLSHNTTPQLPTLLLLTPSGLVLSSASPLPASLLRTQATAASTLPVLIRPLQRHRNRRRHILHNRPARPRHDGHPRTILRSDIRRHRTYLCASKPHVFTLTITNCPHHDHLTAFLAASTTSCAERAWGTYDIKDISSHALINKLAFDISWLLWKPVF
ncbi:hypothetical protein M7I_7006 [Glarea lozoyensis 74030]|uniref:Uncharacterized protein n=1 Tax=Glarea lozoyensis (strain ATCC 74030 / MF5533) TaxID=1104152 RepID=H0EW30_GLAL7|nr:hypothetical protein M7I_7006 [Glarea lozoyensis 74030]